MNKIILSILSVIVLTGCFGNAEETGDQISVSITIAVEQGEEIIVDEEVEVEDEAILLDVLEDHYDVEVTSDGFITEIEGHSQTDSMFWVYEVNQEEAYVGAGEYELSDEDQVLFELEEWEE
ncbi:protein of unknown function [Pelagirhabdus alkalitolerans]|uniref:Transcobalamin-like C-terminal domain-containing protein n=1 Tax=Pelagirhabdus alkalitolerans TaxID=1612202 RepID=A0A1G6HBR0_9BACI|nr:DUF4430 domain-containing protein [Pelagirhabdus alkalitolerans]SDB91593.1 protein of unknown function [Pelagirhabdus alkalitolerans]